MRGPAALIIVVYCCLTFLSASLASARQDDEGYRVEEVGIVLRIPEHEWKREEGSQGGSRWVSFDSEVNEGTRLSLQTWSLPPEIGSLKQLCDAELNHWRSRGSVQERSRTERTVAGEAALAVCYRLDEQASSRLVDVTYVIRKGSIYRISATVALDDEAHLPDLVASVLAGVDWRQVVHERAAAIPFESEAPIPGNVLTVVHGLGPDAPYRYLESLPGAARVNGGLPVVLIVGERLTAPTRTFLSNYRPTRIRMVGDAHPELPNAEAASESWPPGGTVIVAARNLADAVPAAALALQLNTPLVVADSDLEARLQELQADLHILVGSVDLPPQLTVESLSDALAVAHRSEGRSYLALCNVAEGTGVEVSVFAATLAGVHRGVVLPISEAVRVHRAALHPTTERPAGFVDPSTQRWVTGTVHMDDHEVAVAAAVTGRMRISGVESDRYGRPRVDLNGDDRFDGDSEEVRIGSTIQVLDRACAFTVRYQTVFGHPGQGEALIVEPDPVSIRRSIRAFVDQLGGAEHLAILGTPDRIPFALLESDTYFSTLDIKQELASDAPYADIDDDPSLELAVGRVLVPDLERGSAVLATSLAYPRLEGEWVEKAAIPAPGFASAEGRNSLLWVWPESESLAKSIDGELREAGVACDTFLRDQVELDDVLASMRGAGWIAHLNHSNETTWGIRPGAHIGSADLRDLEGAPIVVDTGCSSAGVDLGAPLASTMPGRFFDLGAVAYLGNTRPASLGAEAAVQQMFNRLISDGVTIGQAYRDGRNFLAHLLVHGHIDPEIGSWAFDPGVYERTWNQFYNLNLFGDPALVPRRPRAPSGSLVEVCLEETAQQDRRRLIIRRNSPERVDSLLMLPVAGQGVPREAHLPTAAGLSYGVVPHFYLDRNGLSPLRTLLATAPGAWVDIELPTIGGDIGLELVEGPAWVSRGFSIETDPHGPARLRAYVPLVQSSLEGGNGEVLEQVVFDVISTGPSDTAPSPHHSFRALARPGTENGAPFRIGHVSDAARVVLEQLDARRYDPWRRGLKRLQFSVAGPGSGTLQEDTLCRISVARGEELSCEVVGLPPRLASRRAAVEDAFRFLADIVVNDPLAYLLSGEYEVDLEPGEQSEPMLRLVPIGGEEGEGQVHVVVSGEGRIERVLRRRFGVEEVTHLRWNTTPDGDMVTSLTTEDVRYGQPHVIDLAYDEQTKDFRLPSSITIRVPGLLAQPFEFRPRYERVMHAEVDTGI